LSTRLLVFLRIEPLSATVAELMRRPRLSTVAWPILSALPAAALAGFLFTRFYRVAIAHRVATVLGADALWASLLLVGFYGWGFAINRVLFPRDRADVGLRLAWGMAFAIFAGGLFVRLHWFSRSMVLDFTGMGIALACVDVAIATRDWRLRVRNGWEHRTYWIAIAFLFTLSALQLAASVRDTTWSLYDDAGAYGPFAKELYQNSSLHQPMSLRRLGAFGGQSLLHAFLLPVVPSNGQLNILDHGMAPMIVFFLLVGAWNEMRSVPRLLMLVPVAFLLGLPLIRLNTASGLTGVVMFLALWRTMEWKPLDAVGSRRNAAILGLVGAAACTLRQNYAATVALALASSYLFMLIRGGRRTHLIRDRLPELGEGIATAACLLLFLYPWLSISYESSKTFAFPLMPGNMNTAFPNFRAPDMTLRHELAFFWTNITDSAVALFPLVLVACFALKDTSVRRALPSLVFGGFVGVLILVHSFTLAPPKNIPRYYYAYEVATAFAVILCSFRQAAGDVSLAGAAPLLLAGFAFLAQMFESRKATYTTYADVITTVNTGLDDITHPPPDPLDAAYAQLQAAVPPGAKLLVVVNEPGRFDFARNPIIELDIPGAAAPHGPMPVTSGDTALAEYLQRQSIRYVVAIDFGKGVGGWLYSRETWQNHSREAKGSIWEMQSSYYLGAFDALEALGKTRLRLAEGGSMVLLDLERRPPPPTDEPTQDSH
jgi:hypothetical protein